MKAAIIISLIFSAILGGVGGMAIEKQFYESHPVTVEVEKKFCPKQESDGIKLIEPCPPCPVRKCIVCDKDGPGTGCHYE